MKKWILIIVVLLIAAVIFLPNLLWLTGNYTTRVLVYNGNQEEVTFSLNGKMGKLTPGEGQVYKSSQFKNSLEAVGSDGGPLLFKFGTGQHVINLGEASLKVREVYYEWNEEKDKFSPFESKPKDRLMLNWAIGKGVQTIETCYDCCILLPPGQRPFKHLTPANKDKRFFVSTVL